MNNFIQNGDVLTVIAPADVVSGQIVKVGQLIGVAVTDAKSGDPVEIKRKGVFDLPKATGALTAGDPLYYDGSAKKLTKTKATGLTLVGVAHLGAASGDATVRALLDGAIRIAEA